ncbi:hypothetical protein J6590_008903 [Homalodisca vitripennis]|nr:hypothetical protein J6590_008903 [Homalodisca vitripennis]
MEVRLISITHRHGRLQQFLTKVVALQNLSQTRIIPTLLIALLVPGSMADSTEEIPCMDIILRRSALLVPGSMADSTEEISCMDITFWRSALLVPGSMADSTEEISCMDIIFRRSALLVPGSMADSTEEIPCMDVLAGVALWSGSMARQRKFMPGYRPT